MKIQLLSINLVAIMAQFTFAAPTPVAQLSAEPRDLDSTKQYFHVDSNVLDRRQSEPAKQYFHIDGNTLDKRQSDAPKQYFHPDGNVLDKREPEASKQ